jgi:5-methylcytosine-specific restriction enzyme A
VTLRLCLHCGRHYNSGAGVRGRCGDCGRAYDRELSRQKRARRARNSARWQKARALAKQRDGNRCGSCGATVDLQVHHIVRLEDGGAEFDLSNLTTLCVRCHGEQHRGDRRSTSRHAATPSPSHSRNKLSSESGRVVIPRRTHKHCSHCGEWLPLEAFRLNKRMKDGRSSWCAACQREATRQWREGRREELNRARREAYPAKRRHRYPKNRASPRRAA